MKRDARKFRSFLLGPFIKCPHPEIIEACGLAGFHFVVVDMEHTTVGPKDLYPLILAAERRGISLIVRIPSNEESYFKWCLDLGIEYIQVPFIQSKRDAEYAVRNSFFSPLGARGLCRFVRAADFSSTKVPSYLRQSNKRTKLILQIEGKEGFRNIDSILKVSGVHSIFIGPYDLSQSLGKPGEIWNPDVLKAMDTILQKCKKAHIKVGTFTDTPRGVAYWSKQGMNLIEYASDLNLFMTAFQNLQAEVHAAQRSL